MQTVLSDSQKKARSVIAHSLGMREDDVTDGTPLGDAWHGIAPEVCIVTGKVIIANEGDTAGDILRQV